MATVTTDSPGLGRVRRSDLPWTLLKPSGDTSGDDDTGRLIEAYAQTNAVLLLPGTFHFNDTIVRPTGSILKGADIDSVLIKKVGGALTYTGADAGSHNALFVLPQDTSGHITSDLQFVNEDGTATAIFHLFEQTFDNHFGRLRGGGTFNYAFRECQDFFKTSFRDIRLSSCHHGFDFNAAYYKTSLTFDNLYVINCGTGYRLYWAHYSALSSCAADYIACDGTALEALFPNGSYGDPATSIGVYDVDQCRSIAINGCGAESSYGNGLLCFNASSLSVNGLRGYDIRSTYLPIYANYPQQYVGPIASRLEAGQNGSVSLRGVDIDTWTNTTADAGKQAVIAYNHLVSTYGEPGVIVVTHDRIITNSVPATAVGGLGATTNVKNISTIPTYQDFGDRRIYNTKVITGSSSTTLRLPMLTQGSSNRRGHIRVTMISDESNGTQSRGGVAECSFAHLTSVVNLVTLTATGNVASIAASGLNIDVTLTSAVTSLVVAVEFIESRGSMDYFDYANIALV